MTSDLNPRLKDAYAHATGWEEAEIEEMKATVRKVWELYYKPSTAAAATLVGNISGDISDDSDDLRTHAYGYFKKQRLEDTRDELETYGSTPPVDMDPKKFWLQYYVKPGADPNSSLFPNLAQMARDFLSKPASSAGVERLFSRAKAVISDKQAAMKSDTVNALLCLRNWYTLKMI